MKVVCIINLFQNLPRDVREYLKPGPFPKCDPELYITLNKEYIVYGVTVLNKNQYYLICEDHYDGEFTAYPNYIYHGCFQIIDPRLSKYWIAKDEKEVPNGGSNFVMFGIPEFLNDSTFHSNLIDNISPDVEIFKAYKEKMHLEYV